MLKFHSVLKSSRAAIDLASIMVGVIIIGLIGGVIAATVFAVIPWSQDKAAKQQLEAIATAENAQYGKSSEGNSKPFYGDSATLAAGGWLQQGENYCVVTPDEDKQSYKAAVKSASGKVFVSTNKAPNPVEAVTGETTCIGVGTGTGGSTPEVGNPTNPTAVNFLPSNMGTAAHMVVNKNNKLYSWGNNIYGQLGDGTTVNKKAPASVQDGRFTQITSNLNFTVALQDDNTLWAWGRNDSDWLNVGSVGNIVTPTKVIVAGTPLAGKTIKQISASNSFYYVLTSDNEVYKSTVRFGTKVNFAGTSLVGKEIVKLATDVDSDAYFLLSSEGKVYGGGDGRNYVQADRDGTIHTAPFHEIQTTNSTMAGKFITDIAVGGNTVRVLTSDNKLYGWGDNSTGQLGYAGRYLLVPTETSLVNTPLAGKTMISLAAGSGHTLVLTDEGKVYSAGSNTAGERGSSSATVAAPYIAVETANTPMADQKIVAVSAGKASSYALDSNGKLYAWGVNVSGQMGNGTTTTQKLPIEVTFAE